MTSATIPRTDDPPPAIPTRPRYWAGNTASPEQMAAWVDQFNREGFLFIPEVLPPDWCSELRRDLDSQLGEIAKKDTYAELRPRMFEKSAANLRLFDMEPMASFAEAAIAADCHVIHNNSFITMPGQGISMWHQDDAPHLIVTEGEPPKNIRLPCLLFTANYYLVDVDVPLGGTETVPRSHLFGASCPSDLKGTKWEPMISHNPGPMGSVVIFNNQVWHRGGPNTTAKTRYVTQVSYARRLVGHKYHPFMNYQMPEHCYKDASPRLKRLLGFLPSGAYG